MASSFSPSNSMCIFRSGVLHNQNLHRAVAVHSHITPGMKLQSLASISFGYYFLQVLPHRYKLHRKTAGEPMCFVCRNILFRASRGSSSSGCHSSCVARLSVGSSCSLRFSSFQSLFFIQLVFFWQCLMASVIA